ncbi:MULTISPECIES: DUF1203 domain-containing protein [unclassified Rhizobium]|uniref:DUF1203 domain-containing protein n=1 Tax=unclassified Rhizobium TaxID=2613769 RepID=UPI00036F5570|nr:MULTISPECIES: DUF1203 domain-containing protein [unclassified Rhizobium]MBD9445799.1 DUF1203 domain-containing protein [Rhizobium sp. RHZ01]
MTDIRFSAMPTANAENLWNGGTDAYGFLPETMVSDGPGHPCRHCLKNIDAGEELLVFAYRPFPELQPYAETGPVFLHKEPCERYAAEEVLPPVLTSPDFIVRGYNADNRIVYGTGAVTLTPDIRSYATQLLERPEIAYVHVRSARNNCYQCRIDR